MTFQELAKQAKPKLARSGFPYSDTPVEKLPIYIDGQYVLPVHGVEIGFIGGHCALILKTETR